MGKYSCERCLKEFSQKSHYDAHKKRKTPCDNSVNKIKALVDKAVEEKMNELNEKNLIEEIMNTETTTMKTKHNLGQYFTTHNELKEKVFEFILNNPCNILEPSMGQGDLITFITEASFCSPSHGRVVIAILAEVFSLTSFTKISICSSNHSIEGACGRFLV